MTTKKLFETGGFVTLLTAIVAVVFNLALLLNLITPAQDNARAVITLALNILALFTIYAWTHPRSGWLGLAGLVTLVFNQAYSLVLKVIYAWIAPVLVAGFPEAAQAISTSQLTFFTMVTFVLYPLGYVLFGIGILRSGSLPRPAGWLFIAGSLLNYLATIMMLSPVAGVGGMLVNVALGLSGFALWSGADRRVEQWEPAR